MKIVLLNAEGSPGQELAARLSASAVGCVPYIMSHRPRYPFPFLRGYICFPLHSELFEKQLLVLG